MNNLKDYGDCASCKRWNHETWVCGKSGECEPPSRPCHISEGYEPVEGQETKERN